MSATLVWFRRDLRLHDNPALRAAVERGRPILPVFVWSPEEEAPWEPGAATKWWLHHSLASLEKDLEQHGSRLIVLRGASREQLARLVREADDDAVYWNRLYDPALRDRDERLKTDLKQSGIDARSFNASLLIEPWQVATKQGKPYQVFTPFWKSWSAAFAPDAAFTPPRRLLAPQRFPQGLPLDELGLLPRIDWAAGFREAWQPGENGAQGQLEAFLDSTLSTYDRDRNRPDLPGSSRLSPFLHFGEISPHRIWRAVQERTEGRALHDASAECFLRELGWREFAHHLLFYFPDTTARPLRPTFLEFPWEQNAKHLHAWRRGQTGYPLVDAGMRELWHTGWMHNRVRMVAASFLTKHLRIDWRAGARSFWDTLVDADLANNTLGWQWTAGCGADAAPYFRIFNPTTQAEKFDASGDYIRRWVPELAELAGRALFAPWEAAPETLRRAGIVLGRNYPRPIVDHDEARQAALAAYESIRS